MRARLPPTSAPRSRPSTARRHRDMHLRRSHRAPRNDQHRPRHRAGRSTGPNPIRHKLSVRLCNSRERARSSSVSSSSRVSSSSNRSSSCSSACNPPPTLLCRRAESCRLLMGLWSPQRDRRRPKARAPHAPPSLTSPDLPMARAHRRPRARLAKARWLPVWLWAQPTPTASARTTPPRCRRGGRRSTQSHISPQRSATSVGALFQRAMPHRLLSRWRRRRCRRRRSRR